MGKAIAAIVVFLVNLLSFGAQCQQTLSTAVQARSGQNVSLPDGQILPFEDVPLVRKFRGLLTLPSSRPSTWIAINTTPSHCPSKFTIDDSPSSCTASVQASLADYSATTRERCECIRVISGEIYRLKVLSTVANDPYAFLTATLVVTKEMSKERIRGFVATTADGKFEIFNENRQPVCAGTGLIGDVASKFEVPNYVRFGCFGGNVTANGQVRTILEKTSTGSVYWIGAFDLSDGSRLNIALNITDRDLAKKYPKFPD